ncbi:MAG: hypothetical protein P8Z80_16005 [Pseudolabrys sp.]|jgi:hypothetical protein
MDQGAHITLQSSCGDFHPDFLKRLPALEKTMIERGIDPFGFVIAKDSSRAMRLPIVFRPTGQPIDYTVFVGGRSFTVTYQNDMSFLRYFRGLCVGDEMIGDEAGTQPAKPSALRAWIGRAVG